MYTERSSASSASIFPFFFSQLEIEIEQLLFCFSNCNSTRGLWCIITESHHHRLCQIVLSPAYRWKRNNTTRSLYTTRTNDYFDRKHIYDDKTTLVDDTRIPRLSSRLCWCLHLHRSMRIDNWGAAASPHDDDDHSHCRCSKSIWKRERKGWILKCIQSDDRWRKTSK